ncbi:intracellular septation protein A [compost metagenome]
MEKIKGILKFLFLNFGPLIVFYSINKIFDFKIAVICSIAFVGFEFLYLKISKKTVSSFFIFSSMVVVVFGLLDIFLAQAFFFKLEAGILNLISAVYFALSLFRPKSIIEELARQKGRASTEHKLQKDQTFFFKVLTSVWVIYFVLKAVAYTWMNFTAAMEDSLLYRMTLGPLSFWVLIGLSYGLGSTLWRTLERCQMMPSQRLKKSSDASTQEVV